MPNRVQAHRNRAFENQNHRCFYCNVTMWLASPQELPAKLSPHVAARLQCTAEHVVARCDGGRDVASNIVAACRFCNENRHRRKRPPKPDVYRNQVQRRMERAAWHDRVVHQPLLTGLTTL